MRNLFVLEEKNIFRAIVLLMAVWALCLPGQSMAQEKKDGLTLECKNEPLPEVLKKVEELSGFKVLFTYDDVQEFKVTVSAKDVTINELMDSVLRDFTPPLSFASVATASPSRARR